MLLNLKLVRKEGDIFLWRKLCKQIDRKYKWISISFLFTLVYMIYERQHPSYYLVSALISLIQMMGWITRSEFSKINSPSISEGKFPRMHFILANVLIMRINVWSTNFPDLLHFKYTPEQYANLKYVVFVCCCFIIITDIDIVLLFLFF